MPNPPKLCPTCNAPIPPDAPAGLCPACLLLGAAAPTQPMPGALATAPSIEAVAAAFPDLDILELFGHGGMGVIFKARQPKLDRNVALKILPPDLARQPGFTERFTREARALARLNHPHIVAVYDFGERSGFCFLIMEFVDGVNLRQAMRAGVTPQQALGLVPGICEALQFAHDHGVLHRDIKPENILLDTKGHSKLADFGIAKLVEDKIAEGPLTMSGAALGTAAYMAPEQIEQPGTVDHRADIYSLGVVLYEMLTGELPLGRFAAPSSKAKVTTGVDDVVFRALEKERDRRQQSATEMKTQVENASTAARPGPQLRDDEWVLRCPSCGKMRPFSEVGIRIGAASYGKRILARCSACGFRGMTPLLLAGRAKLDPFVPDPNAGERQGRAAAIVGVVLSALSLSLLYATIVRWAGPDRESTGSFLRDMQAIYGPATGDIMFIPAILVAALGHLLTVIALWGMRYRAPWFFWWLIFYGMLTAPLVVGIAILITVLSRKEEFFFAPEGSPETASVSRQIEDTNPAYSRGPAGIFLMLAVMTALLIPLAASNATMRNIVAPTTLSYFVAIFGALFALWPVFISPSRGQVETRRPVETRKSAPSRVTYICALVSLPLALVFILIAIPEVKARGASLWLPVAISLIIPVLASVAGAIGGAIWRATRRAGASKWVSGAVAVIAVALLPFAILAISTWSDHEIRRTSYGYRESQPAVPVAVVLPNQVPSIGKWAQGSVELVAIARHPSTKSGWWRMDGGEARQGPFINQGGRRHPDKDERAYEFYFHVRDLPPGASSVSITMNDFRSAVGGNQVALADTPDQPLSGYYFFTATFPANLNKTNAMAGVAFEPWHTLSTNGPQSATEKMTTHEGEKWVVTHGSAVEAKDGDLVVVFIWEDHPNWETRVVAINAEGVEVTGSRSQLRSHHEWHFRNLPLSSVQEFQFQVRPIRWIEFQDVALKPSF